MSTTKVYSSLSRRRLAGLAGVLGLVVAGLATGPAAAQTAVRFTLDWRFEGPAALFLMAQEKGYFKAEGLDVTIDTGNGSREAIPRVASGTYDVGFGDVNSLIRFRDENPTVDLKAVMMVYDRPPFAIVGRKSRGITSDVKSLEGKKFGAPAADAAFAQWPIFKTVNKLDDSKMRMENVGFPVREPMLASGEVDAVFGFANSSYINLKSRGVPVDDIVTMLMSDYGVELYGNVVMASPKFMAEKPEALRGLLRAITKGIRDTVANPELGAQLVIKRNDVAKQEVELERLKMTLEQNVVTPWVKANGVGGIDKARWATALDQIGLTFTFKDKAKAGEAFLDSFLPAEADRKL
ncbi:MAG TPA: ABC transporter substrate-binding protein [Bosea sp. (in: a-proteobacteria)]|jgi:NitT/TauT family transport system substrate-binding protein|uniref:ABC transporter substrate-binding protein n=1 Tax=Bosea sp. (in: a-proteobacteria) TaxID=1871050 RepID=UPI002E139594|nr:ABC transporter substrate-binding protein [Bosea sp. (in: a-proteobacteria)]